jgi:hypothetical protein
VDRDDLFLNGQKHGGVESLLSTPRWQVAESEVIDWQEWGDEFVVYVASRAETHLLAAAAGGILLTLLDGRRALTLDDMYAMAIDHGDATHTRPRDSIMSAAEREALQAIVADFARLGIVRPAA